MNLYPHQQVHSAALCAAIGRHGAALDASDTGTGKTPVACAVAAALNLHPAIVCPKPVAPAWQRMCAEWNLEPAFVHTYELMRRGSTPHLAVTATEKSSVATWRIDNKHLLIFDEGHRCGGHKTQNAAMLRATRHAGVPTLTLSATIADSPLRLANLAFVLKLHNGNDWKWLHDHGVVRGFHGGLEFPTGAARAGTKRAAQIAKATAALHALHAELFPEHGSRMRIADIPDFPEIQITADLVDFGNVDAVWTETRKQLVNAPDDHHLTVMLRARQTAELMRVPSLVELAKDALEEGNSVLIFVNFRDTVFALQERLPKSAAIYGEQKDREAQRISFTSNATRVCISTISSGGTGLDLHDTDGRFPRVAFVCPPWRADELKQVFGRTRRANSKSKSVYRILFAAGSVEERALEIVRPKLDRMDLIQDGDLTTGLL